VRLVALLVTIAAVVAAAFAVYLAKDAPAPPGAEKEDSRTQRTLLLQVQGPNGAAAASALLAHDPQDKAGRRCSSRRRCW
jgi:hypothetical protein